MSNIHQLITSHIDIWSAAETEKKSGRGRAAGNAGSVYGIRKLRELILELAVRGKLVPQDANDEPASELLKRIQAEKARRIAEGKIRKSQPLPPISDEEKSFELPQGWGWVRLGLIGDWGAGATPLRSNSSYYGGEMPWFKSGELTADFIDISEETITDLALKECSLRLNQPGDVLIAMYGATIGKTAILKIPGTTNQAVCACTPNTGIFNRYLLVLLKAMKSNFIGQGAGGAQPNISREKIIATTIALPSTEEQHRIVAKVDELMALCDQLETRHSKAADAHEQLVSHLLGTLTLSQSAQDFSTNWQRIAAHFDTLFTTESSIDALKQTLLQLAVMGKLVPQDASDEPASELLKRIQAEKSRLIAEGKIKKDKPLAVIAEMDKPFDSPQGWEWARVGQLFDVTSGGSFEISTELDSGEYAYVKVGDMNLPANETVITTSSRFVNPTEKEFRGIIPANSIIFPKRGGAIATNKKRLVTSEIFVDLNIMAITVPTFISLNYTFQWLSGIDLAQLNTGTSVPQINHKDIEPLIFPLPPLAEQNRIVAKVDELMALCDQLKSRITGASQLQQKLADSLVERAIA